MLYYYIVKCLIYAFTSWKKIMHNIYTKHVIYIYIIDGCKKSG